MKRTFAIFAALAVVVLMNSCAVPPATAPSYRGYTTSERTTSTLQGNPYTTTGYRYSSALPAGYLGSAYFHNGHYYTGGRYETGRFYDAGRYYPSRYYYQDRYFYGGTHRHYDRTSHVWGVNHHPHQRGALSPYRAGHRPHTVSYSPYR